jgi:EAL domain-containing protein (putative c-di-GMP-specific phosphodiesterase class I)
VRTLVSLRSLGVRVAIDDFGTGLSSLAYLRRLPIDKLKIDRSFVRELPGNESDAAIVKAIASMAHALGLRVVAEGIETSAQRQFLGDLKVDFGQGYLFGRPMPPAELRKLLRHVGPLPTLPIALDSIS